MQDKDIDILAEKLHVIWSRWYIHMRDNIDNDNFSKRHQWDYQSSTSFCDLSEEDKEKDRKIAKEILELQQKERDFKCF